MARYAGDFQGNCTKCDEYVEFAIGIRSGSDPVAMRFGPGGPSDVTLREVELVTMMDDVLDVRFEFQCPLCGEWSTGRATCRSDGRGPTPLGE